MRWLSEFNGRMERRVPLAGLTWFGLGGPAEHVVHPVQAGDLGWVLRRALESGVPVKVLGDGQLTKKLKVEAARFSKQAAEKIKAAGGEVVVS